jgi:hypothetical protein
MSRCLSCVLEKIGRNGKLLDTYLATKSKDDLRRAPRAAWAVWWPLTRAQSVLMLPKESRRRLQFTAEKSLVEGMEVENLFFFSCTSTAPGQGLDFVGGTQERRAHRTEEGEWEWE